MQDDDAPEVEQELPDLLVVPIPRPPATSPLTACCVHAGHSNLQLDFFCLELEARGPLRLQRCLPPREFSSGARIEYMG
jgi:hypothetical protein